MEKSLLDVREGEVLKVQENSKGKSRDRVPRACSSRGGGPGEIAGTSVWVSLCTLSRE